MSNSTLAQVRTSSQSKGSARLLLFVIASHVNPDTGWAWPSLETLAHEIALTRRRVIQLIHVLETLGELTIRRGQGRGHVNFYRVNVPAGKKVKSPTQKSEISDLEKVKCPSPERNREREKKGALPAPTVQASDKPEADSPFWCEAHGFCHSERLPDQLPECRLERRPDGANESLKNHGVTGHLDV
jgi:hypothetical protein